jgi:tetratricopeptide (TPR) repeat protein
MTAIIRKSDRSGCAWKGRTLRRSRRFFGGCLLVLVVLLSAAMMAAAVDDPVAAFEQANRSYEQGKFAEAAAAYQNIVDLGRVSPAVYFNLGNALFKSGQVGRAIVHYRLAAQLAPRDPDIRANLQFARNSVGGPASRRSGWWRGWIQRLTLNEWTVLATTGFWLWLLLLTLKQSKPTWQQSLRGYTATTGVATGLLIAGLAFALYDRLGVQSAVVITPEAAVRNGPVEVSPISYTARDGTELTVIDHKGEWLQVVDRANRTGWVRQGQVSVLSNIPFPPPASRS